MNTRWSLLASLLVLPTLVLAQDSPSPDALAVEIDWFREFSRGGNTGTALFLLAFLMIAIPALGLYHVFKFRIQALGRRLDEEMERLVNAWLLKSDGDGNG